MLQFRTAREFEDFHGTFLLIYILFLIFQLCGKVTTGVTTDRSTVLASVIAACRRLLSQPPKGFEKYFPGGKKANGAKGTAGEAKGTKMSFTSVVFCGMCIH